MAYYFDFMQLVSESNNRLITELNNLRSKLARIRLVWKCEAIAWDRGTNSHRYDFRPTWSVYKSPVYDHDLFVFTWSSTIPSIKIQRVCFGFSIILVAWSGPTPLLRMLKSKPQTALAPSDRSESFETLPQLGVSGEQLILQNRVGFACKRFLILSALLSLLLPYFLLAQSSAKRKSGANVQKFPRKRWQRSRASNLLKPNRQTTRWKTWKVIFSNRLHRLSFHFSKCA